MIKELILLIRLAFIPFNRPGNILFPLELKYFPLRGYLAMMWFGWLIYHGDKDLSDKVLCHELIHLGQARAKGSFWLYYMSYLWEWIKSGFKYYKNPYEREAFINQGDSKYIPTQNSYKNYKS